MSWVIEPIPNLRRIVPFVFLGAGIGGLYGALHDQITFTISAEYFTHFKFFQFSWADVGLPVRLFVGVIGFLATWWVGMVVGWFLARLRFSREPLDTARSDMKRRMPR